jgi:hypothetical protein
MFIYHNMMSLIKDMLFCFSTYLTENRDMTHSHACHMLACHYTYFMAPCLFLAHTDSYFRSQSAILWLFNVVLHARFSTISTVSPCLSQRICSYRCITCSLATAVHNDYACSLILIQSHTHILTNSVFLSLSPSQKNTHMHMYTLPEEYKSWSFSLFRFLPLGPPNTFNSTLYSRLHPIFFLPLMFERKSHTFIKEHSNYGFWYL